MFSGECSALKWKHTILNDLSWNQTTNLRFFLPSRKSFTFSAYFSHSEHNKWIWPFNPQHEVFMCIQFHEKFKVIVNRINSIQHPHELSNAVESMNMCTSCKWLFSTLSHSIEVQCKSGKWQTSNKKSETIIAISSIEMINSSNVNVWMCISECNNTMYGFFYTWWNRDNLMPFDNCW